MELLLVLHVPDDGFDPEVLASDDDADDIAQIFVDMINEQREENGASRPGWYKPVMIHAIPGPQWLTGRDMRTLMDAVRLLQIAREPGEG